MLTVTMKLANIKGRRLDIMEMAVRLKSMNIADENYEFV